MNITRKRFLNCLSNWDNLIKIKGKFRTINQKNAWMTGNMLAMFFDYKGKNTKEYIKIYLIGSGRNLSIDVYLLNRAGIYGTNMKGNIEYGDLLIRSFSDMEEFLEFFKNIKSEIKEEVNKYQSKKIKLEGEKNE